VTTIIALMDVTVQLEPIFMMADVSNVVNAHVSLAGMNILHDHESDETVTNASVLMVDGSVPTMSVMESVLR
jgi:hypothetical protein